MAFKIQNPNYRPVVLEKDVEAVISHTAANPNLDGIFEDESYIPPKNSINSEMTYLKLDESSDTTS